MGRIIMAYAKLFNQYLIQSCGTLVNNDESLRPDGTHAMHCIRNGILLGAGASLLGLPLPIVLKGLSLLSAPTGCEGIVDMSGFNLLGNIVEYLRFHA